MGQLRHIVGLVELGWVHFVDALGVDITLLLSSVNTSPNCTLSSTTYRAIVTLNAYPVLIKVFHYPSLDKRLFWVLKPNITLAGEVVLALYPLDRILTPPGELFRLDE